MQLLIKYLIIKFKLRQMLALQYYDWLFLMAYQLV